MSDNPSSNAPRRPYAVHQSSLTGAGMVLNAARAAGLPAPAYVSPTTWCTSFGLATFDDFQAWATWADVQPVPDAWLNDGDRRYTAETSIFDVDVRLTAIRHELLLCPRCEHVVQRHNQIGCEERSCRCYYAEATARVEAQRALTHTEQQQQAVTV